LHNDVDPISADRSNRLFPMVSSNIYQRIEQFNSQRPEKLRKIKYKKMQADPFSFFRGSCHLFQEDWPVGQDIDRSPQLFICGDLHLENFGTYKGSDRQVYFGMNDFDEGGYGSLSRDITRLAVSVLLVGNKLDLSKSDQVGLVTELLDTYRQTLRSGKREILSDTTGIVGKLLKKAADRSRLDLLEKYLGDRVNDDQLQEVADEILAISDSQKEIILTVYNSWQQQQPKPEFYQCLDIKQRLAGLGSLGVDRYLLLIAGKGQYQRYLLDLKEQPTTQLPAQPVWSSSAQRVLAVQSLRQSPLPALLGELSIGPKSFTIRELQPSQDKIKCDSKHINGSDLQQLVKTVGQVTAWSHIQTDKLSEILDYAANTKWSSIILEYAINYTEQVKADFQKFQKAR
jgi:uncharacterized protein (DUF2252 family)